LLFKIKLPFFLLPENDFHFVEFALLSAILPSFKPPVAWVSLLYNLNTEYATDALTCSLKEQHPELLRAATQNKHTGLISVEIIEGRREARLYPEININL
jgi:hypothetical protein